MPGAAGEIYGLTDRGPAVDGRTAGEKVFPLPDFHPQIVRLKLADGTASVERTVTLCGTDGAPLVGLAAPRSGTGESLVPMLMTVLGICGLRIAWLYGVFPRYPTLRVLAFSYPVTWAATSVLFIFYYLRGGRLEKRLLNASR